MKRFPDLIAYVSGGMTFTVLACPGLAMSGQSFLYGLARVLFTRSFPGTHPFPAPSANQAVPQLPGWPGWAFPSFFPCLMQNYVPRINEGGDLKKKQTQNTKGTFLPSAGPQGDRCSCEMSAAEQSKEVTAAWTGLGVPAQNEFARVAAEPWPCVFGPGCHTGSAAGAQLSCNSPW